MTFDNQIESHFRALYATRGRVGTLRRGPTSCQLPLILGRANNGSLVKNDMRFDADSQDLICLAKDYRPGQVATTPLTDDTIEVTIASRTCVFEVRPATDSEQVYSSDPTGIQFRIKTKLLSQT